MSSKKKIIIAISAFALVIMAGVIAVVAVLAAQTVTVESAINLSYNVENVYGSARVTYKIITDDTSDTESYVAWNNEDGAAVSTFDGANGTWRMATVPFSFAEGATEIIIKFEIQKSSASVEDYTATLTAKCPTLANVNVFYGSSESATTQASETTGDETITMLNQHTVDASGADWEAFYVRLKVAEPTQDANLGCTLKWELKNPTDPIT